MFRDQRAGSLHGKEICDLLVVFEQHVVIFSDKCCNFPRSGDLGRDWSRWYKRAIYSSAKQIWGAERWLLEHPDRVFLDGRCERAFPIDLPQPKEATVHRVAVAHGAADRCQEELGGSGSLMIRSDLAGKDHRDPLAAGFMPFTVGNVEPKRGFVHVLDDASLDVVLSAVDTIHDFLRYLSKRESLLTSGRGLFAAGEEELLAVYLKKTGPDGFHDFMLPCDDAVVLEEGIWDGYVKHPEYRAKMEANSISYAWDQLIEKFTHNILAGTEHYSNASSIAESERALRFLAREHRVRRRMLSKALLGAVERGQETDRMIRVAEPTSRGDPFYLFLTLKPPGHISWEEYRDYRRNYLSAAIRVVKVKYPAAEDIVGIATEPKDLDLEEGRTEDLAYLDARDWSAEAQADAVRLQSTFKILLRPKRTETYEAEYPLRQEREMTKGRNRNSPCICGSGRKYKKCCGARSKGVR